MLSCVSSAGAAAKSYGYFNYDARGNITHNSHVGMTYNLANQMTSALGNSYTYDGHNRRVKATGNGDTRYYLYSQSGQLLFSEENGVQTNYIYLGSKLIAEDSQGVTTFVHSDMLGSPVARTNASGTVQSRRHYKPFGDTYETPSYDIGYTGHKYDDDLGLSYMQARYYDPVIGRFYSNDPVNTIGHFSQGNIHGFNRYAYANNNPYKYTDPDGKFAIPLLFTPPALAAMGKAAAFVSSAAAAAWAGSEAINAYNESADPVEGILDGATEGEKTKGRTKNL